MGIGIAGYRRAGPGMQPRHLHPAYVSSIKRAPTRPLIPLPHTLSEITGPIFDEKMIAAKAFDLTRQSHGAALGERIIVSGRLLDEDGRAIPRTLIEVWQANAAGRYPHQRGEQHAPIEPKFARGGAR